MYSQLSRVLLRETYILERSVTDLVARMGAKVWEAFDRTLGQTITMQAAMTIDQVAVGLTAKMDYEVTITWNTIEHKEIDFEAAVEVANDIAEKVHGRIYGSAKGRYL